MRLAAAAAAFGIAFTAFAFLFLAAPVIPDADSYFHLAVARAYAESGYLDALPWARFSILGSAFGDKELLFHFFLAPFTTWTDAATGGRLALALLNAVFVAMIAWFAWPSLRWWGLAVPLWLYAAAPMMTFRLIRLRPELGALLLLIAFLYAAASRRLRWVAVLAAAFALSYTAFHVVIGLAFLWFLAGWREREWKLPLAAAAGAFAGLLVHPGFPANLRIWWIQNALFFLEKGNLDVGTEITALPLPLLLLQNLGWFAGIVLLWFVSRGTTGERRRFLFLAIAAGVFAILTLLMQRMAIYLVPFATLMLLTKLESRDSQRRAPIALLLLATAVLSFPTSRRIARDLLLDSGWERDYASFARAVPKDATIAAHWGTAESYVFWAPHGRYLNFLDPIFMAVPHPAVYEAQRLLFEGRQPDVVHVAASTLASDYIAFPSSSPLFDQVQFDPRVEPVWNGLTFLGRISTGGVRHFVRDWRLANGAAYRPRSNVNAFIDATGLTASRCIRVEREEMVPTDVIRTYELASYGPAELRIDGQPPVRAAASRAILGKGTRFRISLKSGRHRFLVTTCSGANGTNGFYLLAR